MVKQTTVSLEAARRLIEEVTRAAQERQKSIAVAICDPGGELKAFSRMDGAPLLASRLAQDKAFTAVSFGMRTDQWYDFVKDDPPLALGIPHTPRLVIFGGGFPLRWKDELVGGLGVSGGHYTDDMACGMEGLKSLGFDEG